MVSDSDETALRIARLEARVAKLETILAERSRLLRVLTRELCDEDLMNLSLLAGGLPPIARSGFGLLGWRETTALSSGDVDRTMEQLWRSVAPPAPEEE